MMLGWKTRSGESGQWPSPPSAMAAAAIFSNSERQRRWDPISRPCRPLRLLLHLLFASLHHKLQGWRLNRVPPQQQPIEPGQTGYKREHAAGAKLMVGRCERMAHVKLLRAHVPIPRHICSAPRLTSEKSRGAAQYIQGQELQVRHCKSTQIRDSA